MKVESYDEMNERGYGIQWWKHMTDTLNTLKLGIGSNGIQGETLETVKTVVSEVTNRNELS